MERRRRWETTATSSTYVFSSGEAIDPEPPFGDDTWELVAAVECAGSAVWYWKREINALGAKEE